MHSFQEAINTPFTVLLDDARSVDFTLVDVVPSDTRPGWEAFSLLFSGPSPPAFWDGLYTLEHPRLGAQPMFLVAISTDGDGQHYEAVFNRPQF
ncbi:MAG: DUF6916 family protein [Acidimicrobiales bacterium]